MIVTFRIERVILIFSTLIDDFFVYRFIDFDVFNVERFEC